MSLSEIKKYHQTVEQCCKDYLEVCKAFMEEPSVLNWKAYCRCYPAIYAALWNSFFWRMYLKERSSTLANEAGVSTFLYEQMLTNTQSRMQNYELDHAFRRDICRLATKIGGRISKPPTVAKILDHVRDSDCRCLGRIKSLSRDYRISKNEDISNDYPVEAVAEKVREAIVDGDVFADENVTAELTDFLPGNPSVV